MSKLFLGLFVRVGYATLFGKEERVVSIKIITTMDFRGSPNSLPVHFVRVFGTTSPISRPVDGLRYEAFFPLDKKK